MSYEPFRVGARTSRLARRQAGLVLDALAGAGIDAEFVGVETAGDRAIDVPIGQIGGVGVFTRELERALAQGEVDAAVHSLKDLATEMPAGLEIGAMLPREDPRDVLVLAPGLRDGRTDRDGPASGKGRVGGALDLLPTGAVVGTASLRRRAFLLHLRPDLRVESIRGNVPTRLEKLDDGPYDAVVLAAAGLLRLGLEDRIDGHLPTTTFPSAPGQGAVAIQIRSDDSRARTLTSSLDHPPTATRVAAERAFLRRIEGGCQVPAGALAELDGGTVTLTTLVCSTDGERAVAASATGTAEEAAAVGLAAADRALQDGADEILAALRAATAESAAGRHPDAAGGSGE
ncbi:MAG: hydroxymethylbilane synthase [Gemmatimonadota bacterium]